VDGVEPVVWSNDGGDVTAREMIGCGFAGVSGGRRGIYGDFWAGGGAEVYDGENVRAGIADAVGAGGGVVVFAWKNCGFATKARKALIKRGIPNVDVTIDRYSPLHAELAFATGRTSVPYIFVNGELVGGCDADDDFSGLMGVIDDLEI